MLKVHHLNCTTLCPRGGRWVGDGGRLFTRTTLVCHCLLLETDSSLALVDTGFGTRDVAAPHARLGSFYRFGSGARLDLRETALRQILSLGFSAEDVEHIVLTHLDADHAGGLSDFPNATVHVLADEHAAATAPVGIGHLRYRPQQWAHGPNWRFYTPHGERWFGFECVRGLQGLPPEVLFVPLRGHSLGHAGVAVSSGRGWLLHAGDAYFHHGEIESPRRCPPALEALQRVVEADGAARRHNQQRLRDLVQERGKEVSVFSSHDPREFERLRAASEARTTNGDPRKPLPIGFG
jgi:glyoxylase-like metal-dependent hydrolase (beta-lactamase superfamily II)